MTSQPISYKTVERLLKDLGFVQSHVSSSHTMYKEPQTGSVVLLPPHRPTETVPIYKLVQLKQVVVQNGFIDAAAFENKIRNSR